MDNAMEKVDISKLMEVIMMEILSIIRLMDMGDMKVLMGLSMKGNGKITCLMEQVKLYIQMDKNIVDSF